MRLKDIHSFFVQQGMVEDPRPKTQVREHLRSLATQYRALTKAEKKFFDKEDLWNPYPDTRILSLAQDHRVQRIFVGIDIGVAELLFVESLARRGCPVDLVLSHHPLGSGLAGLSEVMGLQAKMLEALGMDKEIAGKLMQKRIDEVANSVHGENHFRVVDAARQLDIPLMCCHTPADNHVVRYLQRIMDQKRPATLKTIMDLLLREPEYRIAAASKTGPRIIEGKPKDKAGKIFVDMTGGTEGSRDVFARLSQAGVKTLVGMHMSASHLKEVKNEYIHVVIAGHIASDNLGMNLLLDKLEAKIKGLKIVEGSGFRRVRR